MLKSFLRRNGMLIAVSAALIGVIGNSDRIGNTISGFSTNVIAHMRAVGETQEYVGRAKAYNDRMTATARERAEYLRRSS